jgi:hypothetical protein
MIFKIIKPDSLTIEHSYEADEAQAWGGPWGQYPHVAVPEGLDPECVVAQMVDGVIVLVEESSLIAAKAERAKLVLVSEAYARLNADVYAEAARVLDSSNPDSANANQVAWKDMYASPADYVGVRVRVGTPAFEKGHVLANTEEVISYASERVAAVRAYGVWRENRIAAFEDERAAILGG